MRAALSLAVKVGATKNYTNHDIVKFLESVGAEFGTCQNATTSADETIYELSVPVDRSELLSQAISVLAEFCSEFQQKIWKKKRGAVLEEYRGTCNANGRMQDARWNLMMKASKGIDGSRVEKVIHIAANKTTVPGGCGCHSSWRHLNGGNPALTIRDYLLEIVLW
ncbi:hypothetical protein C5167_008553 [Papaver somniferum]|uniref:Peptidase M16 N-terminal domain-containing protein n=1 Tax=Papaver somniferum TaxID=3469 RepID=A0A4Y7JUW4_PAPSO|nr:hypothetical protein C5167_008553 [Papaver somniferum]